VRRYQWEYFPKTAPREVKDGIKAKSARGKIGQTWWSGRWIAALEEFTISSRLQRGRSYARHGQVIWIEIAPGIITAAVQGSRRKPYSVAIELDPISDRNWEKIADRLASQAIFAAKLLAGEMPQDVEDAFNAVKVPLFPTDERDLETDCSCPDYANPCKHIAAVYYLLAERFDEDPFLIFKLRGRTKEQIIEMLRERRAVSSASEVEDDPDETEEEETDAPALEECLNTFWRVGASLEKVRPQWRKTTIPAAVLRRLGPAPFTAQKKNGAETLAEMYATIAKETEARLARLLESET